MPEKKPFLSRNITFYPGLSTSEGWGIEYRRRKPSNPLSWVFYQLERPYSGTIALIKEIQRRRRGTTAEVPYIKAMWRGFKEGGYEAQEIIKNPVLAFVASLGLDPLIWIPFSWGAKAVKVPFKLPGIIHASKFVKQTDTFNKIHNLILTKFTPAGLLTKYHPRFQEEVIAPGVRLLSTLEYKLSDEVMDLLRHLVPNPEELEKLTTIVHNTPIRIRRTKTGKIKPLYDSFQKYVKVKGDPAQVALFKSGKLTPDDIVNLQRSLDESMLTFEKVAKIPAHIPEEVLDEYMKLSLGAKIAYQWELKHRRYLEKLKSSHGIVLMETMLKVMEEGGREYVSVVSATRSQALKILKVREAILKAGIEKVPLETYLRLADSLPENYRKLGYFAMKHKDYKSFTQAVEGLIAKKGPTYKEVRAAVNEIGEAQALRQLKQYVKVVERRHKERALDVIVERAQRGLIAPKLMRSLQALLGRKRIAKSAITQDLLEDFVATQQKSPYRSLAEFYNKAIDLKKIDDVSMDEIIEIAGKLPKKILEGEAGTLENIKHMQKILEEGHDTFEEVLMDAIQQKIRKQTKPYFALRRTVTRGLSPKEIVEKNIADIELNLAAILGVEGKALARAIAGNTMLGSGYRFLSRLGYLGPKVSPAVFARGSEGELEAIVEKLIKHFEKRGVVDARKAIKQEGVDLLRIDHPLFKTVTKEGEELYHILPKSIARELKTAFRLYKDPKALHNFLAWMRKYQGWWKAWTLGPFPVYHFRNNMSNVVNNFLAGIGDKPWRWHADLDFYRKAAEFQHRRWRRILTHDDRRLMDELIEHDILYGGETIGEFGEVMSKLESMTLFSINPSRNYFTRAGFWVGRNVEENARIAHYLWARNYKKLNPIDAAKSVHKFLFNYKRGLSPFETKWLRNFFAPFWAWTRFNIPLQLEFLVKRPGKLLVPFKLKDMYEDAWGGPAPEEMFMAEWMKRSSAVRIRYNEKTGTYEYFMLDNWLPTADLMKVLSLKKFGEAIWGLLSPFVTLGPELLYNYNLFKKRAIREYKGQKVPFRFLPGGKVMVLPEVDHLLRHIRLLNEVDRLLDVESGISLRQRTLRWFVGKSYPYRPKSQKQWWLRYTGMQIRQLKYYKNKEERAGRMKQAEHIQKLIDEEEKVRKYYQAIKI